MKVQVALFVAQFEASPIDRYTIQGGLRPLVGLACAEREWVKVIFGFFLLTVIELATKKSFFQ